ncbi:MAG: arabinan endo-1,5-alpha-L-arabinosidase [Bacteroides sp.]|nr:arabinan endo-1,5-alpha-L-arabinosidase [Roseburia sp.]MCM1346539.1 arabinan endo-1,5-alpha-L-arabinosidase [Bacteroides sp.]MCM1421098.1 arabinan endo-1,5-alpha-L-arabinosidase [Bacteroides sp.]
MKKTILPLTLSMATSLFCVAQTPEKVYVNRGGTENRTDVYNMDYVKRIGLTHGNRTNLNDSLRFEFVDGSNERYTLRTVDSLTFFAPDALMRLHIEYQNKNYSKFYPTYSDNYVSVAGWNQRASWQLANIHDPSVMKAADGYFYMSQTDAGYGNPQSGKGHYYMRRSKDLVNWEPVTSYNNSCPMPEAGPSWMLDSINAVRERRGVPLITADGLGGRGYWAPTIRRVNDNLYRMYYSIVVDGNYIKTGGTTFDGSWNEPAWIGLMETSDPASGKWEDKGAVLCSASDKGKDAYSRSSTSDWNAYSRWNAIDPSYIITPEGEHWLLYGSWHSGIAAIQLDPETGKTLEPLGDPWNIGTGQTSTYGRLVATRNKASRWQASEGPEVIYNPETGYYYLFLAYDELAVAYNTRVVRSKSITGPYLGMNGTNVTTAGGDAYPVVTHPYKFSGKDIDGWVGFSHCAVFDDGRGNWYYCSQARKPENYEGNAYANALMMGHVRKIYWTSTGWPVVSPERYANVEQAPITRDDLVGTWELIDMSYSYGKQKTSSELVIKASTLSASRVTLSGALSGSATFNPDKNILNVTLSSTSAKIELCIGRELDWESSPRKATVVCGGYTANGTKTYWGKKVQ